MATSYDVCVNFVYGYPAIFVRSLRGLMGTNPYEGLADMYGHPPVFNAAIAKSLEIVLSSCGGFAEMIRRRCSTKRPSRELCVHLCNYFVSTATRGTHL